MHIRAIRRLDLDERNETDRISRNRERLTHRVDIRINVSKRVRREIAIRPTGIYGD